MIKILETIQYFLRRLKLMSNLWSKIKIYHRSVTYGISKLLETQFVIRVGVYFNITIHDRIIYSYYNFKMGI